MRIITLILLLSFFQCSGEVHQWKVRKVKEFTSDESAFTQGLLYENEKFYLSTGIYGRSSLRVFDSKTGKNLGEIPLLPNLFGEGIAKLGSHIYQLTWKNKKALAYREGDKGLERDPQNDFTFNHQGWGLTSDGKHLIISDGSSIIRFLSGNGKSLVKTINVTYEGKPVKRINEMEYVEGKLFANILGSPKIVVIDPESGKVTDVIHVDVDELFSPQKSPLTLNKSAVLNGIAFDPSTNRLFITGKLWPKIFEVSLY